MKLVRLLVIAALFSFSTASLASVSEKTDAAVSKTKGSIQESVGDMTNDSDLKAKGKANKLKGNLKNTKENIKDTVSDAVN